MVWRTGSFGRGMCRNHPFRPSEGRIMSGTLIAGAIVLGVVIMVAMAVAVAVRPDDPRRHDSQGPPSF